MKRATFILVIISLLSVGVVGLGTAEFRMSNGDVLRGTLVAVEGNTLIVDSKYGQLHLPKSEIERIIFKEGNTAQILRNPQFTEDLQYWEKRQSSKRGSLGDANWSGKYDGSARLHVSGAPGNVELFQKTQSSLPADTVISAYYEPSGYNEPSALALRLYNPVGERVAQDRETDKGENDGKTQITVPKDMPAGSEIAFKVGVWPGENTIWVKKFDIDLPS